MPECAVNFTEYKNHFRMSSLILIKKYPAAQIKNNFIRISKKKRQKRVSVGLILQFLKGVRKLGKLGEFPDMFHMVSDDHRLTTLHS